MEDLDLLLTKMYADDIDTARKAVAEALSEAARVAGAHAIILVGTDTSELLTRLQRDITRFRDDNVGAGIVWDTLRKMGEIRYRKQQRS